MSQAEQSASPSPAVFDDQVWDTLLTLTGGASALCYQCGTCTAVCPWSRLRGKALSIRKLIRRAQLGLPDSEGDIWFCTACDQCEAFCPREVDITKVIRSLRFLAWQRRQTPASLPSILWSMYWNDNPWSQPPSHRSSWTQTLGLSPFDPDEHEILLYVGCTASYDRRSQMIARAVVRLLRAADVPFGYLGDEEPCCGESVFSLGHQPFFLEIAEHTSHQFREKGVSKLLTISPHCYDTFKNHYPGDQSNEGGFIVQHYSQFLVQLVEEGRLKLTGVIDKRVTFHDPCYLARRNGDTASARQLLKATPGLKVVEMAHKGSHTLCCGGGGGRMFLEDETEVRFADLRILEAVETQAEILVTACPFCITCLEDSVKKARADLVVLDLAEVAVMGLNPLG